MALPTAQDLQDEIADIQALITTHRANMAAGMPDLSYTLPTGHTVNATGYMKYLQDLRKEACRNYQSWFPEMAVSQGR